MLNKKLWIFPLIFGLIGAFIGLVLRYAFIGNLHTLSFKFLLHAHSHVMLLGFLFNALLALVWINFTPSIDKVSYKYYIAMQVCMALMIISFLLQGYAFYSILFSTLHLWISYIVLIRLWKKIEGNEAIVYLLKFGIAFHFLSSLGPYALGPLMVLNLKTSPWYQQAIFFYLHFQFFGVYFSWLIALLAKRAKIIINKKWVLVLIISLILLFSHSLDYSFDHWSIHFLGGLGSVLLLGFLVRCCKPLPHINRSLQYIYYMLLAIALLNISGSFPYIANFVINNRFILIAWLHFLFLGLYVPFIWIFLNIKIYNSIWFLYGVSVFFSEILLVFMDFISSWTPIFVMLLLFIVYLGVFISISMVHISCIFNFGANKKPELSK